MSKVPQAPNTSSTLAKSDDGTIQITFSIPFAEIKLKRAEVIQEEAEHVTVPGFRPGKAPLAEVEKKLEQGTVLEKTLTKILPKLLSEAITQHKIRPAIYPKFELINAKENEAWQVRAVTCEIPNVDLAGYKERIKGLTGGQKIWTPGKDGNTTTEGGDPESDRMKKEQEVIKILLSEVKITLPKILIDDEVNARLSKLLERIEKLGLSLDSYLASIGKKVPELRNEYETAAREAISLDLILTKIADEEKLEIDPKSIEAALKAGQADPKLKDEIDSPERKLIIENILKRRKALDFLMSLA